MSDTVTRSQLMLMLILATKYPKNETILNDEKLALKVLGFPKYVSFELSVFKVIVPEILVKFENILDPL